MALWQDRKFWRATGLAVALAMSIGVAAAEESAQLAPGVAAYQAGKTDQAIKALSGVLSGGTASGTDVARAYYFRGLAYSKSGKPAQAIADLNNALWLKGLAADERANAHLARGKAYQATGLEQRAAQDFREAEKLAPGAASQELAAVAAAEAPAPATVELQNNAAAPATDAAAEAPQSSGSTALVLAPSTVQTTAKKSTGSGATSVATVGGTATTATGGATEATASTRERGTVSRTSNSEAISTATVPSGGSIFSGGGDFFSDLFSSGSSSEPVVTDSTSVPAEAAAAAVPAKRKATLARGESADFSTSTAAEVPAATVVASAAPAATATDAPLVLAPDTPGSDVVIASAEPAVASEPAVEAQVYSWSSETVNEQASFAAAGEQAPAEEGGSDSIADVGTSVGSFFENLFSGNQPADTTGTVAQTAPAPAPQEMQVAAVEPVAQAVIEAAPAVVPPAGRYRAQIATVRSPEEAQIIARRMQTERKALLGDRRADIEPVVLGNMGTFYAVMIGPFADERSSERFCGKLQSEGVDCFVTEP